MTDFRGAQDRAWAKKFCLTAQDAARSGAFGRATVILSCRYQGCEWGLFVGEMELWEFIADAREHWESRHARTDATDSNIEGSRTRP